MTIAIAAGGAFDLSGNPNNGSTAVDSSVTWPGVRPVSSLSIPPTDSLGHDGPLAPDTVPLMAVLLLLPAMAARLVRPARLRWR